MYYLLSILQLFRTNKLLIPRLMPVRIFNERGAVVRREYIATERYCFGLNRLADPTIVDQFLNQMLLQGHLMDTEVLYILTMREVVRVRVRVRVRVSRICWVRWVRVSL